MGVMLNPYGNRLGISNFWQGTFNVYYSENLNFKFYELLSIFKFVVDLFILNLFENTKSSKDSSFLLLFVSLNLNVLRFKNKRLDVFLKLFDYRMFVMLVENNYKTRHFMLLRFLRMFFRLFTFRLKKLQTVKNIVDWKLLVFYEHLYNQVIQKEYKEQQLLNKRLVYETKNKTLENGFFKLLYKLRYFQKFSNLELLRLKVLKKYVNKNEKLKSFFNFIKRKYYYNLFNLKRNLFFSLKTKKNKAIIFNLFKNFVFFNKFRFLFEHNKKKTTTIKKNFMVLNFNSLFSNLLEKLNNQGYNKKYKVLKNNKSNFEFKFYRTNYKIFFFKKRPFAFTIFQKNIIKSPFPFLETIKKNQIRTLKYSDYLKLHNPFFFKSNLVCLKSSLTVLRKRFFSQIRTKQELYFRQMHFNFSSYVFQLFFSNSFYNKIKVLYLKLKKNLEIMLLTDKNLLLQMQNDFFFDNFYSFVKKNITSETFNMYNFFDYDSFLVLMQKCETTIDKKTISKNLFLFSRLIFYLYNLKNFYNKSIQSFNSNMSKNTFFLQTYIFKCYVKLKFKFNRFIKSFFFVNKKKKVIKDKLALTKKYKLYNLFKKNELINSNFVNFYKKNKRVLVDKSNILNKGELVYSGLINYKLNLNNYKQNKVQNQNIKDTFVNKFDYFFSQAIKKNKKMVVVRMKNCHDNFIVLTLPFLFKIMQLYNFEYLSLKCSFITSSVSAVMIARYAITRMRQGFSIGQALYGMRFGIKKSKKFAGFKFCAAGRFSRRQIATYRWIKGGSLSINTRIFGFDYAHDNFIGTFGIYGFKVWLLKAKPRINYTYG